jgi:hypothetical protein
MPHLWRRYCALSRDHTYLSGCIGAVLGDGFTKRL